MSTKVQNSIKCFIILYLVTMYDTCEEMVVTVLCSYVHVCYESEEESEYRVRLGMLFYSKMIV